MGKHLEQQKEKTLSASDEAKKQTILMQEQHATFTPKLNTNTKDYTSYTGSIIHHPVRNFKTAVHNSKTYIKEKYELHLFNKEKRVTLRTPGGYLENGKTLSKDKWQTVHNVLTEPHQNTEEYHGKTAIIEKAKLSSLSKDGKNHIIKYTTSDGKVLRVKTTASLKHKTIKHGRTVLKGGGKVFKTASTSNNKVSKASNSKNMMEYVQKSYQEKTSSLASRIAQKPIKWVGKKIANLGIKLVKTGARSILRLLSYALSALLGVSVPTVVPLIFILILICTLGAAAVSISAGELFAGYDENTYFKPGTTEATEMWNLIWTDHVEYGITSGCWQGCGTTYFQCTDFASWRVLISTIDSDNPHGTAGGNGKDVAENLVSAYPDEYYLVYEPVGGAVFSVPASEGNSAGHVGYIEKVTDEYVWISDGNVGKIEGSNYTGIRINYKIKKDYFVNYTCQGGCVYAAPIFDYDD